MKGNSFFYELFRLINLRTDRIWVRQGREKIIKINKIYWLYNPSSITQPQLLEDIIVAQDTF